MNINNNCTHADQAIHSCFELREVLKQKMKEFRTASEVLLQALPDIKLAKLRESKVNLILKKYFIWYQEQQNDEIPGETEEQHIQRMQVLNEFHCNICGWTKDLQLRFNRQKDEFKRNLIESQLRKKIKRIENAFETAREALHQAWPDLYLVQYRIEELNTIMREYNIWSMEQRNRTVPGETQEQQIQRMQILDTFYRKISGMVQEEGSKINQKIDEYKRKKIELAERKQQYINEWLSDLPPKFMDS